MASAPRFAATTLIASARQGGSQPVEVDVGMWHWPAEVILFRLIFKTRLNLRDERGAEYLLAGAHGLQGDSLSIKYRHRLAAGESIARAVHMDVHGRGGQNTCIQLNLGRRDALDATHSHDVGDAPQLRELRLGDGCAAIRRRGNCLVDAQERACMIQSVEQLGDIAGICHRFERLRLSLDGAVGEEAGLDQSPVEDPRAPGRYPRDVVWVDTVAEHPENRVHTRLAGTHDNETRGWRCHAWQLVEGNAVDAVIDVKKWPSHGGYLHVHVGWVDDPACLTWWRPLPRISWNAPSPSYSHMGKY